MTFDQMNPVHMIAPAFCDVLRAFHSGRAPSPIVGRPSTRAAALFVNRIIKRNTS